MHKYANVEIKLGRDEEGYYSSDFELPRYHNPDDHYCPTCAGNHRADHCQAYNRIPQAASKYRHAEVIRRKQAEDMRTDRRDTAGSNRSNKQSTYVSSYSSQ